ncbi:unnamed protein product [Caenorhabditis nigoni]
MKLHRMPFLVQKMIITEMGLDERMLLSFTSKRTCRLLGMSKLYTSPYLSIKVRSDGVEVRIENEDKWRFFIPYDKSDLENVVYWKIDGSDVRVSHEVKEIDLEVLFSKIKIRELKLNVKVASAAYKYQKHQEPIGGGKIQKLILQNHSWVDFSELPTARIISFSRQVQSHEINTMLKSWVTGKNREMEVMYSEIGKVTDRTRSFLFTGITQHETQLTEAERDSFLSYWFQTNDWRPYQQRLRNIISLDIVRKGDGLRATVIVATAGSLPDPEQKVFVMVWSEENLRTIGRAIN